MTKLTRAQVEALHKLWQRHNQGLTYLQFRRTAWVAFSDYVAVPWCGMHMGIESDGYTHS